MHGLNTHHMAYIVCYILNVRYLRSHLHPVLVLVITSPADPPPPPPHPPRTTYRLLNGCLQDAHAEAPKGSGVLRAQTLRLFGPLVPLQKCRIQTWLQYVGRTSVVIGHALYGISSNASGSLSRPIPGGEGAWQSITPLARGSCVVLFLDSRRRPIKVPQRDILEQLVHVPRPTVAAESDKSDMSDASEGSTSRPTRSVLKDPTSSSTSELPKTIPANAWSTEVVVSNLETDASGFVNQVRRRGGTRPGEGNSRCTMRRRAQ
jgi:acyl-CoA thioesterase FadM